MKKRKDATAATGKPTCVHFSRGMILRRLINKIADESERTDKTRAGRSRRGGVGRGEKRFGKALWEERADRRGACFFFF